MESVLLTARRALFSCAEEWEDFPKERNALLPEVSITKVNSIESAITVTDLAMRIVGAVGLDRDRPLERYFRDAKILEIGEGTSEIQRIIISREILNNINI